MKKKSIGAQTWDWVAGECLGFTAPLAKPLDMDFYGTAGNYIVGTHYETPHFFSTALPPIIC